LLEYLKIYLNALNMNKKITHFLTVLLLLMITHLAVGQTTVSGVITDKQFGEPLIGANIKVKNELIGTVTDIDGNFSLTVDLPTPFTLVISYIGYTPIEKEVTTTELGIAIVLEEEGVLVNEVVVSASRVEERILESPVTIEKMDPIAIKQAATADYYDAIANLKGVQSTSGSLSLTSINTRGFGSISNTRFVQLMDGMDNAAPLLNFPTGNVVGISELDIHSVELIPGAASALYGANAFNGILLMTSKNPFDYQGLSAQVKVGMTNGNNMESPKPQNTVAARYAKSFAKNKLAFKANISYMRATDWIATNYTEGRQIGAITDPPVLGSEGFDGLNTYGDETQVGPVPSAFYAGLLAPAYAENADLLAALAPEGADLSLEGLTNSLRNLRTLDIRRTGIREADLLETERASSFKVDGALHYRPNDKIEISYSYRRGQGDGVYQGSERYALRKFNQQFHKFEITGDEFFVRAYTSMTDDGDSYNLAALGGFVNEAFIPTAPRTSGPLAGTSWLTHFLGAYGLLGLLYTDFNGMNLSDADHLNATRIARQVADGNITNSGDAIFVNLLRGVIGTEESIPQPGSEAFENTVNNVRDQLLPNGAGFIDNSRLYNVEFNYNFKKLFDVVDLQVGAQWRQYDLFTQGTVFLEDPDGDGINERIHINEYGAYTQIGKKFFDERLKLQASARFDKNQNFKGQVSPRVSVVYTAGQAKMHNVRASWQTGFRNPATQDQYIFFPSSSGILIGSTESNAARFGIHNGGAYTESSYAAAQAAAAQGNPNAADLLEVANIPYVQPEKLNAAEIGYKGVVKNKLMFDFNAYFNVYTNFMVEQTVVTKTGVNVGGVYYQGADNIFANDSTVAQFRTVSRFRPTLNAPGKIKSYGTALGIAYKLPKGFRILASYNYDNFFYNKAEFNEDFEPQFNLALHKWQIGLSNQNIVKGFGFDIQYRWSSETDYQSSYANALIPAYGVLNAQVSYQIPKIKTTVKLGGQNLLRTEYQTNPGGPTIGWQYYVGFTFDQLLPQ
jgi:outer membrane receptor protein involved in Fe transport